MKKSTNKSSRKWLWPTIISVSVVILGIATGVICWAIGKAQEDKESGVSKDKVVMIVTSRGGMCSDGPCDHKRYSLYEDGRFEDHENLTKTEVTRIKNIVSKFCFYDFRCNCLCNGDADCGSANGKNACCKIEIQLY